MRDDGDEVDDEEDDVMEVILLYHTDVHIHTIPQCRIAVGDFGGLVVRWQMRNEIVHNIGAYFNIRIKKIHDNFEWHLTFYF